MPQLGLLLETNTLYIVVLVLSSALLFWGFIASQLWLKSMTAAGTMQGLLVLQWRSTESYNLTLDVIEMQCKHLFSRCWLFQWTQFQEKHDVQTFILADTQRRRNMCYHFLKTLNHITTPVHIRICHSSNYLHHQLLFYHKNIVYFSPC